MSTFVSLGNAHQAFSRLLAAVTAHADALPQPIVVQHGHTPFFDPRCTATAFLEMSEFGRLIADSQLLILHAGTGGILQALKVGKVPIIAARRPELGEHIDDHQVTWGRALAATQRVVLLDPFDNLVAAAGDAIRMQAAGRMQSRSTPMIDLVREALLKSRT